MRYVTADRRDSLPTPVIHSEHRRHDVVIGHCVPHALEERHAAFYRFW